MEGLSVSRRPRGPGRRCGWRWRTACGRAVRPRHRGRGRGCPQRRPGACGVRATGRTTCSTTLGYQSHGGILRRNWPDAGGVTRLADGPPDAAVAGDPLSARQSPGGSTGSVSRRANRVNPARRTGTICRPDKGQSRLLVAGRTAGILRSWIHGRQARARRRKMSGSRSHWR